MSGELKAFEDRMSGAVDYLGKELTSIRAGRANPAILDKVMVDYYDTPTPINQVAAVSVAEARVLSIQPWDPTLIGLIEKAIHTSDLGINPTNDGRVIRLVFPAPNEERRKELSKEVTKLSEDAKVSIRNVRRDAIDKLKTQKKNGELTEDDLKSLENDVQKLTDKYVKECDKVAEVKNKEIMEL